MNKDKDILFKNHKLLLAQLKEKFIQDCDNITTEAKRKLELTTNKQSRQKIFIAQQNALNQRLNELMQALNKAEHDFLKELEKKQSMEEAERLININELINNI